VTGQSTPYGGRSSTSSATCQASPEAVTGVSASVTFCVDSWATIADGARAISDFKVLADQKEAFGQVASVPTAYRTLEEIAEGGDRTARKLTAAVNAARRYAWAQVVARHGKLPGVRVADKVLAGVTCIRLDATVTFAHSEKELAEGNFKGRLFRSPLLGSHPAGHRPAAWEF